MKPINDQKRNSTFQLEVCPRGNNEYGFSLYQLPLNQNVREEKPVLVSRIWGFPVTIILDAVLQEIRAAGYRPGSLHSKTSEPYVLSEEAGVRLGLLFMSIKPLQKRERIEQLKEAIYSMATEEAYYWNSRCRYQVGERACRAFRILFAEE